jgi:hypothetical protein
MRKYFFLLYLVTFVSFANNKFVGIWEGSKFNGLQYSSHILQIDGEGNGFYIYSMDGQLDTKFYYSFKSSPIKFKKGYFVVPTFGVNKTPNLSLLLTQNMNLNIFVATTILYDQVNYPFLSTQWHLVKTDKENIKNNKLFSVAQELYNKPFKKDK